MIAQTNLNHNTAVVLSLAEARKLFFYVAYEDFGRVYLCNNVETWFDENICDWWDHSSIPTKPEPNHKVIFTFSNEEDAVAFKLRWV